MTSSVVSSAQLQATSETVSKSNRVQQDRRKVRTQGRCQGVRHQAHQEVHTCNHQQISAWCKGLAEQDNQPLRQELLVKAWGEEFFESVRKCSIAIVLLRPFQSPFDGESESVQREQQSWLDTMRVVRVVRNVMENSIVGLDLVKRRPLDSTTALVTFKAKKHIVERSWPHACVRTHEKSDFCHLGVFWTGPLLSSRVNVLV